MTKAALCYIRYAPYEVHDASLNEQAQRDALKGYCALKQLQPITWIVEQAPATTPFEQRAQTSALLEALASMPNPKVIVSLSLDRLATNATDVLSLLASWRSQQVDLHLLSVGGQPVELSTMMGPWFIAFLEGISAMELLGQREALTPSPATPVPRHARDIRGSVPYGYQLDDEGLLLIEEPNEQRALRELFRLYQTGYSMRRITTKLNEGDFPARGERWHVTTVARLIKRLSAEPES